MEVRLFGSAVRNELDDESDIDLLVVTSRRLTWWERHEITDLVFEMNLSTAANLSTLVVPKEELDGGLLSLLPISTDNRAGEHHAMSAPQLEIVRRWWGKARESLRSAERELAVGSPEFAVNRLYYAAFYAVTAWLAARMR